MDSPMTGSTEHRERMYSHSESSASVDKSIPQKYEMSETRAEHAGNAEVQPAYAEEHEQQLWWSRMRENMRDFWSEFFGTMMIILFGDGVVAQVVLSEGAKGEYQSISWGWGIGVMLGVYVGGKSGGHLNPAVTFCNCLFRGHPWRKFPTYVAGQVLGAMAGAFVVYGNYRFAIDEFEGGSGIRTMKTAGIFCTYPADFLDTTAMFWSEVIASAILMFVIFAFTDKDNIGTIGSAVNLLPLALFFLIFGIGACWGWLTGYAINLARDFGPRLVSYILGYGTQVWSAGNYYFWIPMVAPFVGCTLGAFLYDLFLYEGESPINTPWIGVKRLAQPRRSVWSNTYKSKAAAQSAV